MDINSIKDIGKNLKVIEGKSRPPPLNLHGIAQFTDDLKRDTRTGYTHTWVQIPYNEYPRNSDAYKELVKQIRDRISEFNRNYAINRGDTILHTRMLANPTVTPAPVKYASTCQLDLDIGTGNTIMLVASSKAGKTTMQMHLYQKYFSKSIAIMFAHNPQIPLYKVKNLIVTDDFQPDIVEIARTINKITKNKFEFTFLFDDQLNVKNQTIQDLFLSLRNSNISSIISLQYINLMAKSCRGNVNHVLGGSMNSDENILVFIKCYLQTFMHSRGVEGDAQMILHYRELTKNHGFVNIHPSSGAVTFCRLKL